MEYNNERKELKSENAKTNIGELPMKKYVVSIKEVLEREITILAKNEIEAERFIKDQYNREEIVLDSSDFSHMELSSAEKIERKIQKGKIR